MTRIVLNSHVISVSESLSEVRKIWYGYGNRPFTIHDFTLSNPCTPDEKMVSIKLSTIQAIY